METEQMFHDDAQTKAAYLATQLSSETMPEKRLMLAVLMDALDILNRPPPDGKNKDKLQKELDEAVRWIEVVSDHGIFSFAGICGCLDFDAECLRKGIRRLVRVQEGGPESGYRIRREYGKRSTSSVGS